MLLNLEQFVLRQLVLPPSHLMRFRVSGSWARVRVGVKARARATVRARVRARAWARPWGLGVTSSFADASVGIVV